MMTAARRKRAPKITETQEHCVIAAYFRKIGLGGNAVAFHIRGERMGDGQRLQAWKMGAAAGLPDWMVIDGGRAIFAELKPRGWRDQRARTGSYTAHEQRQLEVHDMLRLAGASVVIVETLDELLHALRERGVPIRSEDRVTEALRKHLPAAMAAAAPIPQIADTVRDLPNDTLDEMIDEAAGKPIAKVLP